MQFSVQNLCGFLIRGKLMSSDAMQAMYQRWQHEARNQVNSTNHFARWLVANKYVTEHQANLLVKGHTDGFFLGRYMILERLGRGRMAGVYKAAHPLGQVVAIKVLPPSKAKEANILARFQRETRLSLKLRHPNIVRSFQVGRTGDLNYLVMEYLEGETLEEVLQRRKRLPPAEAVRLVHQALTGLQHIHERGMIHRDLKPANLMLIPTPAANEPDTTLKATVKILDIGLAREMFDESQVSPRGRADLTAEGVLLGTPDYLAPEQARDPRTIDIRADIYSLGCVLFHALSGQPPFPDRNILSQMVRHATEKPKPLKDFNPQIPDGLQQIVNWMLAKKPEERYPTPERAGQALQMFLLADNVPAKPFEDAPQMKKYLDWLESHSEETVAFPAAGAVPAQKHLRPDERVHSFSHETPHPPHRKSKKRHKRSRRRDRHPMAAPAPLPTAAPAPLPMAEPLPSATPVQQYDVELVPASGVPSALPPAQKRDWMLLGLGAGATLLAILVIWLIVVVARS